MQLSWALTACCISFVFPSECVWRVEHKSNKFYWRKIKYLTEECIPPLARANRRAENWGFKVRLWQLTGSFMSQGGWGETQSHFMMACQGITRITDTAPCIIITSWRDMHWSASANQSPVLTHGDQSPGGIVPPPAWHMLPLMSSGLTLPHSGLKLIFTSSAVLHHIMPHHHYPPHSHHPPARSLWAVFTANS